MRAVVLAAVFSGALMIASRANAQVSYGYSGAYPNYYGAYSGLYAGGSYGYGGVYGPQSYYGQQGYGYYPMGGYYPNAGYSALGGYYPGSYPYRPYVGPALLSSSGIVNGGFTYLPQTPINNSPYYSGYTRYAQYGLRRAGGGRMFGTYVPRDYGVYQPRPGGLFDR